MSLKQLRGMVQKMKMKTCPYCGKELSGEAVLCKFCHNLLIDESGNVEDNGSEDDGRTKVFKKAGVPDGDGMTKRFVMPDTKQGGQRRTSSVIADSRAEDVFPDDGYDDDYDDDGYDDFEEEAARKRLFTITAIITVIVLAVVIAAIVLGMQAFGKKSANDQGDGVVEAKPAASAPADTQATQPAETQPAETQPTQTQPAESTAPIVVEGTSALESLASSALDSNAAMTNSMPDASSQLDSSSSQAEQNFATETSSGADSASSAADANSQAATPDELENQVRTAVAGQISGNITGSQFREMDGSYAYYYFFTDDGAHGYSVAYNTADGTYVCQQNY